MFRISFKAGVDVGSVMAKAVIMNGGDVLSHSIKPISGNFTLAAGYVLDEALEKAGVRYEQLEIIGATGLGASFLRGNHLDSTEVTCQSRGMNHLFPSVRIIIEIGDQSSRVIKVTERGRVADCIVNDRCAAGSGRILQIIAKVLRTDIDELGGLSSKSSRPVRFSTSCSVFLETEIISRVAEGTPKGDIIAGLHQAMASKILAMARKVKMEEACGVTGGGAKDAGLVKMLQETMGVELLVPDEPFITAAIGSALLATEKQNAAVGKESPGE
ncbi:MAG: 2-hydroxyglutaryl-CoA dehydratase [Deltaproteobacteria bacterium]|nr:2-hydroxyglutaryl-CoA dehydratase [Deltaproteobacteria bacterium]